MWFQQDIYLEKFESFEMKNQLMKNKSKLHYLKDRKVFLYDDLTHKERNINKIIQQTARIEKEKG